MLRSALLTILCLCVCLTSTGCALLVQPEHQAFAISLSVDKEDDGGLTIGVQIPSIGGSAGESQGGGGGGGGGSSGGGGGGGGGSDYAIYSATAASFPEALDLLRATMPSPLKLSELKSLIVSEKIARSDEFARLIEEVLFTYQMYGAATVVITTGKAKDFLKEQKPTIGTRLSTTVVASLEHFHQIGDVPPTSIFTLFDETRTPYSDPIVALAANNSGQSQSLPEGQEGGGYPGSLAREGGNKNEYMGSALIKDGKMVGILNGAQTRWLLMLRGEIDNTNEICQGKAVRVSLTEPPAYDMDLNASPLTLDVRLALEAVPLTLMPDLDALSGLIRKDIQGLFDICQALNVEPLGIAGRVAWRFPTIADFTAYGFGDKFSNASIRVKIDVAQTSF